MRNGFILAAVLGLAGCGAAYEITSITMDLEPPPVMLPAISPGGIPVPLGDLSNARGRIELDVVQKRLAFTASGLPQIPGNRLQEGFRYRLWLRDAALTPIYIDELKVDQAGRTEYRRIFTGEGPPLASIREAIVVLWFDDSPVPIDPAFSSASSGLSRGGIGSRKDYHSGGASSHTGWVLEGLAEDLPAGPTGEGGHQH